MTITCWIAPGGRACWPGGCPGGFASAECPVIATTAATHVERARIGDRRNRHLHVQGSCNYAESTWVLLSRLRPKWVTVLYLLGMNLQQLRYLVTAADAGSFSAASRTLQISQPVLSRALHSLERECKLVLFRRDGRRLVLTDAGTTVVASARR